MTSRKQIDAGAATVVNGDSANGDSANGKDSALASFGDSHAEILREIDVADLIDGAPDGIAVVDDDGLIVLVNRQIEQLFGYDRADLIGESVETLIPEGSRRAHRAHRLRYRAEPQMRPMGAALQLWARSKDGRDVPVEIALSPIRSGGTNLVMVAVRDVSERREVEAAYRRVLASLDAIDDGALIFDIETWRFSYVNEGAVAMTGYERRELLKMTPMHLLPAGEGDLRSHLAPLAKGRPSVVFETELRNKAGDDVPVEVHVQLPATAESSALGESGPSYVAVVRDITTRRVNEAIEQESLELRTTYKERERIARDLHDVVIQRLFGAGMSLQAAIPSATSPQLADRLFQVVDDLDDTIRQIRSVIFQLQAPTAANTGLRTQILQVVGEGGRLLGFEPRVHLDGPIDAAITDDVAQHVLAVLREALSNVARHAHAHNVNVEVHASDAVMVRVEDDGIGFVSAPKTGVAGGNGLQNMATRATSLHGSCHVGPGSSGGTIVEWRVPLS